MRRVGDAVEAAAEGLAAGRQVDRCTDRGDRAGSLAGAGASLLGPAQQRIAAERDADGEQWLAAAFAQARQHPADLFEIARVVGARREVQLARAAAEMRHREVHPGSCRHVREGLRVVAARRPFEAMEQHQPRCAGRAGLDVDVDEVTIRREPAFALVVRCRRVARQSAPREQRRPDGLHIASRQPARCAVRLHRSPRQCSVDGASTISGSSRIEPGLAWCATRRQPCAVFRYTLVAMTHAVCSPSAVRMSTRSSRL